MYKITLYDDKLNKRVIDAAPGATVMEALSASFVYFPGNCGGIKLCDRCYCLIDGIRKRACEYRIDKDVKVVLPFSFDMGISVVGAKKVDNNKRYELDELSAFVDIGTTTIAMALADRNLNIVVSLGVVNPQLQFGADVISRISFAKDKDGLSRLHECVVGAINNGIGIMLGEAKVEYKDYSSIPVRVSGNPTMIQLLNNESPESIGRYPFTPSIMETVTKDLGELKVVTSLRPASGFIGSDVLVGAYDLGIGSSIEPILYLDLGTNGEMIMSQGGELYACSAACGPAFEQALRGDNAIRLLRQMLSLGEIDSDGLVLADNPRLSQDAIRMLQLAKGAIRSGVECLLNACGVNADDVSKVYIAGGFGFYMNVDDAVSVGMLPSEFKDKIEIIGNMSLKGNVDLKDVGAYDSFASRVKTLDLANLDGYQDIFMKYISFS